jgi:predicted nuclease of predicted toxin-antitoxin system
MNWLVDENVHRSVIERRVDAGHAVRAVGTVARGATDAEVVGLAVREGRVIVTADRDFAELAARLPGCPSIVLARSNSVSSLQHFAECILKALTSVDRESGLLAVVEPGRIRVRRW